MSRRRKSYVSILVDEEVYRKLAAVKNAFNARSFSQAISMLIEHYYELKTLMSLRPTIEKPVEKPVKPTTPEQEVDEVISSKPDLAAATKLICTKHPEARASKSGWSRILLAEGVPVELIEEVIEEALEPCPGDPDMLCVKEEACAAAQ